MNANPAFLARFNLIVENIKQLPALPAVVGRLIKVVNSPDSSAEDAADLIEKDPALTSKILRLANSAFYGVPRSVSSVNSAVVILGFNTIKSLVLSASVIQLFPANSVAGVFDRVRFWKHSIVCAMMARTIAHSIMNTIPMDPQSAFCAGIMHDIGKLIFELYTPAEYKAVCNFSKDKTRSLFDTESMVLGVNHAQVGSILADKWALPLDLESVIVHHHAPQDAKNMRELVAVVHLADVMAHAMDCGLWDKEASPKEWESTRDLLGVSVESFKRLSDSLSQDVDKYKEFLSIIS
jgi:putative nucleotidyltransferase with HDIG domain